MTEVHELTTCNSPRWKIGILSMVGLVAEEGTFAWDVQAYEALP